MRPAYKPGNKTDLMKHLLLTDFLRLIAEPGFQYFELHAGEGKYLEKEYYPNGNSLRPENRKKAEEQGWWLSPRKEWWYKGSPVRALETLTQKLCGQHTAFFNEKYEEKRKKLEKNLINFRKVPINGIWENHIQDYLGMADENSLFFIDPTYAKEYEVILSYFEDILNTGAKAFLYLPQSKRIEFHKKLVEDAEYFLQNKEYKKFQKEIHSGHRARIDNFLIVCEDKQILNHLEDLHETSVK